ncbi:translation initiation factor IF-2 [Campylobacter devanensis]|uniref:translation initiation factor IF-2 n=1 Tax=Campylobacter devanensis TaxID=3161138 RepID=UPI000A341469|nr:translation initiation factor IF-2 [Campylobacter sp. P0135]
MAKIRIHEIAKELGSSSKKILEKAKELGFAVTTVSSAVSPEDAAKLYDYVQSGIIPEAKSAKKPAVKQSLKEESKPTIKDESLKTQLAPESVKVVAVESKQQPESNQKDESKPESLANSSINKRRGLVIVKKKKDEQPKVEKSSSPTMINNKALESMFGSGEESFKKKKKDKKQFQATKKESSSKLDLMGLSEFGDDIVIDDEDVVVLPDLTVKPIETERVQTTKKPLNIYKPAQNNGFNFEGGIQRSSRKKHKKVVKDNQNESVVSVDIPKEIRVYEFADKIKKSPSEIIGKLFMLGKMTTKNDFLEEDEIEILGAEFGIEINIVDTQEEFDYVKAYEGEDDQHSEPRAPVVTIMGHVDHGKTSLLDYIQNSRVASGEAGGITQHVGAYMVEKNGKNITFIDTPGHEAFTAMRARGASVTDIVIIVVAADDGVKPQTKEAIAHAKAAGVPIIIAINKMDKESANPDLVKSGLAELDIMPTEWGGSYEFVPVSAKTGMGIEDLLEIVLLQAEILELKANPNREAKATIIESSLQKGRGPVATVIVENGTLKVGDTIVAGVAYGKVRALSDDKGRSLKAIKPGECGVLIGLSEVPEAGETLISVKSDKEAREYAQKKYEYLRQKELSKSTKVTIDELSAKIAEGELKNLPVIIKADVQGSLEAIKASLEKLRNDEIKVSIIHSGVGGITQSDISLASASQNCVILGFNIRPTGDIKEKAKEKAVEIKTYNVIYNLLDDVKALLSGLMSPVITEEDLGQAVIRQVINVPKVGQIAGCMVTEGIISRGAKIRVIRDGVVVFEGNISSLKRFKDDAKEVAKGYECGIGIEGYNDMREGDYIESYKEVENKAEI